MGFRPEDTNLVGFVGADFGNVTLKGVTGGGYTCIQSLRTSNTCTKKVMTANLTETENGITKLNRRGSIEGNLAEVMGYNATGSVEFAGTNVVICKLHMKVEFGERDGGHEDVEARSIPSLVGKILSCFRPRHRLRDKPMSEEEGARRIDKKRNLSHSRTPRRYHQISLLEREGRRRIRPEDMLTAT